MGRELGAAADLSIQHADSGGATHHAQKLRHTQRQRGLARPDAEHYPADPRPDTSCIIDQFNLYGGKQAQASPDEKVERMRKDINIELVRDGHNEITAFNVSYSSLAPKIAQLVTSELTNLFINENLEVRQQQSQGTTQFLESQLENARKGLADQEDRIRQFKGQHVGRCPGNHNFRFSVARPNCRVARCPKCRKALACLPANLADSTGRCRVVETRTAQRLGCRLSPGTGQAQRALESHLSLH